MKKTGTLQKKISIILWCWLATFITYTLYATGQLNTTSIEGTLENTSGSNSTQIEDVLEPSVFTELARTQINENQRNIKGTYKNTTNKETALTLILMLESERYIKSIITENTEVEDYINDTLKTNKRSAKEIIEKIREKEEQQNRCNTMNSDIASMIINCSPEKVTLTKNTIEYTIEISGWVIHEIASSDATITAALQERFMNTTIHNEGLQKLITEITAEQINLQDTNTVEQTGDNIVENQEQPSIQQIFKKTLIVELQSVKQKENQALVTFQLSWITFTANYQIQNQEIKWLFIDSIKIGEKPLLIRTFSLQLSAENQSDINNFQQNPLQFIKKFYPNIEEVFTKYHQ